MIEYMKGKGGEPLTAKELAKKLGISAASVSYALNGKPGVSVETRTKVKEAARTYGMNFIPLNYSAGAARTIYLIYYMKQGPRVIENTFDNSFYSSLTDGITRASKDYGYHIHLRSISNPVEMHEELTELNHLNSIGIIILATEMTNEDFMPLAFSQLPVVLLDNRFRSSTVNSVTIDNINSTFAAADYLCRTRGTQPGYLKSSVNISNFIERKEGFDIAIRHNGLSPANSVVHELSINPEGTYADMLELLKKKTPTADCYVADNDFIALGAMKAFKEMGYRIPEDVAFVGFDDLPIARYSDPGLTTMHVPIQYMGMLAVERLHEIAQDPYEKEYPLNIRVNANLVIRHTV